MKRKWQAVILVILMLVNRGVSTAQERNVKITPIGQRTGDFCGLDRALLFEDPTGVRILYDPGMTVTGATDPRLGDVHAILISHAHGDHLGAARLNQDPNSPNATCAFGAGNVPLVASPNTNAAEIAAAKNSAVIAGGPLATVIGLKIAAVLGGLTTVACPQAGPGNELVVPRPSPCTAGLGISAKRTVRIGSANEGVQIAAVSAEHTNELPASLLTDPERTNLAANGLGAYVGLANGFVITFTNGLKVYLSGDTGLTSDMSTIVNGFYGAALAVLNIGDIFTTGAEEAAFAVTNMIRPRAVIPSHANEVATTGGIVTAGSRTARFIDLLSSGAPPLHDVRDDVRDSLVPRRKIKIPVYTPRSGVTMEFDSHAGCRAGCR